MSRRASKATRALRRRTQTTSPQTNYGVPALYRNYLSTEVKHFDQVWNANPISNIGNVLALSQPTQGVGASQRIGNVILVRRIEIDLFFQSADSTNFVRSYLLACPNGQSGVPGFANWYDPPDEDFYIILKRKHLTLQNSATTVALGTWNVIHNFPGSGLMIHYDSATSTSEIFNRLMLVCVSDSSASAHPTVTGSIRVFFTDN